MRLVNWRSLAIGVAGLSLAACGDDVSVIQPQSQLTVNPSSVTCQQGQQVAIGASLNPSVTGATFTYTASGTGVTVAGNGATATITCNTVGASSVTITSGNQTFTLPVTVTPGSGGVTGVIITPSAASVTVGGTVTLSATVLGSGTLPAVRYRSANTAIATVDSISGVVTGRAVGSVAVFASPAGNTAVTASATITVVGAGQIVQSISANPSVVALQSGQTQQVTANVTLQPNAPAGASRAVTYTSSNNAIATVSSTGLVTAVANGSTSIIIRSVADTSFTVAVPVTVTAPAPVTITIANVTTQTTNQLVDITQPIGTDFANVGNNNTGSIFVTLNLDPGAARVSRVDVFLAPAASPNDTTNRVCSQIFSATAAEALRIAQVSSSADVQPITCPINLAAFDTLTGIPGIRNGQAVLRARVTGTFPGTTQSATQIAQFTQTLQIRNLSGFFVRVTNTPSAAQAAVNARGTAQGPDGRNWLAGSLTFTILPVSFEAPGTGNNLTPEITVTLTDNTTAFGPLSRTQTVTASTTGATTVTFPGQTATQPGGIAAGAAGTTAGNITPRSLTASASFQNIDGWTSGPGNAGNPAGTTVSVSGIGFNTTAAFQTLSAQVNGAIQPLNTGAQNQFPGSFQLNIDNTAPQPATSFNVLAANFTAIPGSQVGFIGGAFNVNDPAVTFASRNFGPTFAGGVTVNNDFGGVDRVTTTYFAQLIANLSSLTAANVFTGGTQFSNGSQLAAANQNTAYAAIARFTDVLGNSRNQLVEQGAITLDANGQIAAQGTPVTFGVDLSAPTISVPNASTINGVVVNAANQGTAPNSISLAYSDDIGFGATPIQVLGTQMRRANENPANGVSTYCFTGVDGAGNAVFNTQSTAQTGLACGFVSIAGTAAINLSNTATGQYDFRIRTRDQAGNQSTEVNVTRYVDIIQPVVGGVSLPQTLTGNAPATFTTAATDNLELGSGYAQIAYAANAAYGTGNFQISYTQSRVTLGSPFGTITASVNNSIALNVPSFIRSVTFATGGVPAAVSTANLAQAIVAVVDDAAGNQGSQSVNIPQANISLANFGTGAAAGTGANIFDTGNQTSDINGFALTFANNAAAFPNQLSLGATTNAPTTGTFSVTTTGQVNAFINPFVRVELYYAQVGGQATYQFLGTAPVGIVTDVPANGATGRTITSNFVFTPVGTALARGVTANTSVQYNVIAVGITANGDALVSAPVTVTVIQ
ncbi:beta strand repeat-containing protein [Roseisolibacter agri]|uniref:BIG2 domain-containing protein n=1 Tax=Roseisolibacter agri TaxID=2014610 RepID=A0AA37Q4A9_9BACT|nr:Ig-like domain-containing protein [Roseisolibacter agri]GLC26314.1 hypothetical protein rosag_28270 [Roseisolibacter agri]